MMSGKLTSIAFFLCAATCFIDLSRPISVLNSSEHYGQTLPHSERRISVDRPGAPVMPYVSSAPNNASAATSKTPRTWCPCDFQSSRQQLTCSNANSFHELRRLLDRPKAWCVDGAMGAGPVPNDGNGTAPAGLPAAPTPAIIRRLNVFFCRFNNFTLDELKDFTELRQLTLNNNHFVNGTVVASSTPSLGSDANFSLPHLEELDLMANNLEHLSPEVFRALPMLHTARLSENALTELHRNVFASTTYLKNIYLRDNPWWCQGMEWILDWIRFSPGVQFHDRDQTVCTSRDRETVLGHSTFGNLIDLCPSNCTCRMVRGMVSLDCRNKGYLDFPPVVPEMTGLVHMENNHIESLFSLINTSNYRAIRFLYLDNNKIDSISILEGTDYFDGLYTLHINGNRLTHLPVHVIDRLFALSVLNELKLGNNPWNCECSYVVSLQDLLIKYYSRIPDVEQARCAGDSVIHPNQAIHRLSKVDFCSTEIYVNPLDILNACLVFLILLIVCKLLVDYRRMKQTGQLPGILTFKYMPDCWSKR